MPFLYFTFWVSPLALQFTCTCTNVQHMPGHNQACTYGHTHHIYIYIYVCKHTYEQTYIEEHTPLVRFWIVITYPDQDSFIHTAFFVSNMCWILFLSYNETFEYIPIRRILRSFFQFFHVPHLFSCLPLFNLLNVCYCYCCSVTKSCLILCDPMDCSTIDSSVLHYLPEFA